MSHGRQNIELEGYFAKNVLGIFRVIRGFADLRDPALLPLLYKQIGEKRECPT